MGLTAENTKGNTATPGESEK